MDFVNGKDDIAMFQTTNQFCELIKACWTVTFHVFQHIGEPTMGITCVYHWCFANHITYPLVI